MMAALNEVVQSTRRWVERLERYAEHGQTLDEEAHRLDTVDETADTSRRILDLLSRAKLTTLTPALSRV